MKFNNATDFRKSLEARLKNISDKTNQDLQRLRRQVAFDRLLARIFEKNNNCPFLLKGGYAMELRFNKARTTRDLDLTYLERFDSQNSIDISEELYQEIRDLSQAQLNDYFSFQIRPPEVALDSPPYGGVRIPIEALVDGRIFVRFQIDIGMDITIGKVEKVKTSEWLDFCDIPAPQVSLIAKEQQFAEKIHAYSLPRQERINSRVKDFVDLVLLIEGGRQDIALCYEAITLTFRVRNTHPIPLKLSPPPTEWEQSFSIMAGECGMETA